MDASKEAEVVKLAKRIIEEYSHKFNLAKIIVEPPVITRKKNDMGYSSELVINLNNEDGLLDVLEFFIYENDKIIAEIDEFEVYIRDFFKEFFNEK